MAIYIASPSTSEKNLSLVFSRELANDENYTFNGKPITHWNPIKFKWYLKEGISKSGLILNDFILVFGAGMNVVINKKVKLILENEFPSEVEFLPIQVLGESLELYLINVINLIDNALNQKKSEFKTRSNGSKGRLKKAVFTDKAISADTIFSFPESPRNIMCSGEKLRNLIVEHNLTGLEFKICSVDNTFEMESKVG